MISEIAKKEEVKHVIISNTSRGKSICSKIAIDLNYELISNVISSPLNHNPFKLKCKAFSSKALCSYQVNSENSVITILLIQLDQRLTNVNTKLLKGMKA